MAATTFVSLSANYFPVIAKTTAAAYRTSYKVYGDLNNDNVIDSFDVIALRKAVVKVITARTWILIAMKLLIR